MFIERSSHLYRALAAVPPWIHYLLTSQSSESSSIFFYDTLFGVCLCGIYLTCKAYRAIKLVSKWKISVSKLLQSTVNSSTAYTASTNQLTVIEKKIHFLRTTELFLRMKSCSPQAPCAPYAMTDIGSQSIYHANIFSVKIVWQCGWIEREHVPCVDQQWQKIRNGKTVVPHTLSSFSKSRSYRVPFTLLSMPPHLTLILFATTVMLLDESTTKRLIVCKCKRIPSLLYPLFYFYYYTYYYIFLGQKHVKTKMNEN